MRPIDADLATEQIKKSDLTNREKIALLLCLSSVPTIAPPPNDPLTLEELREMSPHEWCWIERKMKPGYYCKFRRYTNEKSFSCGWPGSDIFIFDYEDYGKDWLAYRCKPEEGVE